MKRHLPAIASVLLVVLLPMVLLHALWTNPVSAGEDDLVYYYPMRVLTGQSLAAGRIPMTDPLTAMGSPVLPDPQAAVLNPMTWLFAVLPGGLAYSLSIFLAFALAGLGMLLYMRRLGLIGPAALVGAVAFQFSGFFIGHRVHLSIIQTACWLPCLILGLDMLGRRMGRRDSRLPSFWGAAILVPAGVLCILGGHWPTVLQMGLMGGVYLLLRVRPFGRALLLAAGSGVLAALICAPQLYATGQLLGEVTRGQIDYMTAGENSYVPFAAVLMLMPMLMGTRSPNLYPQHWWGPWHLCEMLGYVGLLTLVLAGSAVRGLWSKRDEPLGRLVRTWVWMGLFCFLLMLGYYLPSYRLFHMIPGLSMVRCPARMILGLDLALCVLAAVGLDRALSGAKTRLDFQKLIATGARWVLPMVLFTMLLLVTGLALLLMCLWPDHLPMPFVGGARDVLLAAGPWNPAVLIPLWMTVATAGVVGWWLARPARRWMILLVLLIVDLYLVAGFVDVPANNAKRDPQASPAAQWIRAHSDQNWTQFRIWSLSDSYHRRGAEMVLPRTNTLHGLATISGYGPFQSPMHEWALDFTIFGTNSNWREMLRRGRALDDFGVRYILAEAESPFAAYLGMLQPPAPGQPDAPAADASLQYYPLVDAVEPLDEEDPPILIYENPGWKAQARPVKMTPAELLAWREEPPGAERVRPRVGIVVPMKWPVEQLIKLTSLPGLAIYGMAVLGLVARDWLIRHEQAQQAQQVQKEQHPPADDGLK
jgi:hypothetical protein